MNNLSQATCSAPLAKCPLVIGTTPFCFVRSLLLLCYQSKCWVGLDGLRNASWNDSLAFLIPDATFFLLISSLQNTRPLPLSGKVWNDSFQMLIYSFSIRLVLEEPFPYRVDWQPETRQSSQMEPNYNACSNEWAVSDHFEVEFHRRVMSNYLTCCRQLLASSVWRKCVILSRCFNGWLVWRRTRPKACHPKHLL